MDTPTNINTKLREQYGMHSQLNVAKYRVVHSTKEVERRQGDYNVFTEAGIFLRREHGIVTIRKYHYLPPCWVLERAEINERPDLIDAKYTYEPIVTFIKGEEELPLEWRVVEYLVTRLEFMVNNKPKLKTESEFKDDEEKELKEEQEKTFGILDAEESTHELPTFKSSVLLTDKEA
jgi:hypothetical protein